MIKPLPESQRGNRQPQTPHSRELRIPLSFWTPFFYPPPSAADVCESTRVHEWRAASLQNTSKLNRQLPSAIAATMRVFWNWDDLHGEIETFVTERMRCIKRPSLQKGGLGRSAQAHHGG